VLRALLLGVMYSSAGLTMTELTKTVAGGNAKVCHFELSIRAVASVVLRVVRATVIIPPWSVGQVRGLSILAP
jgi:hypothetical protein